MKTVGRRLMKAAVCAVLALTLFVYGGAEASAITTKFMVPTISNSFTPDNCIYKSPNLNIMVCKWGYGWVVDILNTNRDLGSLLAELNANFTVSSTTSKEAIMGIYMEGEPVTAQNAADMAAGNWKRVELYYENFLAGGSLPRGYMLPNVAKSADADTLAALADVGITADAAVVEVSGFDMAKANFILYEKEFKFLRGKTVSAYKFLPDLKKFVPVPEVYFDSYDRNFLELHDLQMAEADVNGIYVVLGQTLPAEAVITAEEAVDLRKNPPKEPAVLTNAENTVAWTFPTGEAPEGFTAAAAVTAAGDGEVSVDFAYSGSLPEGTEVTVTVPAGQTAFADGTPLFFYYCEPDTGMRELVSRGVCQGGQVTFAIEHCSAYVITAEDHGERWQPEVKPEAPAPGEAPAPDAPAPDAPGASITFPDAPAVPGEKPADVPPAADGGKKPVEGDTVTDSVLTIGATEPAGKAVSPLVWAGTAAAAAAVIAVALLRKKRK